MPARGRNARDADAAHANGEPAVPERIFGQVSPQSVGGMSLFEAGERVNSETVGAFVSEPDFTRRAVLRLQDAGFEVLQVTPITINIAGSADVYQRAFNTTIVARDFPVIKGLGREDQATFLDSPDTPTLGLLPTAGTRFEDVLDSNGACLEVPRYPMGASMFAPPKTYPHLNVPADVSLGCNADRAHRSGITGRGVKVAMVDSGWFQHPYFVGRGYRAAPVVLGPGASNPLSDESGHGTGESANIFAVAPDVDFLPVKISFVNSVGSFNAAVSLRPDIITCSWGSDLRVGPLAAADQALAAAIAAAVAAGITVVFSAGNGHYGGAFMDIDGSLRASDYASGFMSQVYPGRRAPDLCGLVGMRPKAIYIMLPVEPGDEIDSEPWDSPNGGLQGGKYPDGDETAKDDGWGAFSGTSAAAPQLAGAAALVKQAAPSLKPAEIRDILMRTARDVTTGRCSPREGQNHPATVGPDLATGTGLVDAHKAVLVAKVRSMASISLAQPARPAEPAPASGLFQWSQFDAGVSVAQPVQPVRPVVPMQSNFSDLPAAIYPSAAGQRPQATVSTIQSGPQGAGSGSAQQPSTQLTGEDVQALEAMISTSEIDLDI
jgi:subtilisin family serine protease